MSADIKVECLRYFLQGYYNQSFDDDELENLVYEFRYGEEKYFTEELIQELKALEEVDDWELVAPKLTGDRRFKPIEAKELVKTMLRCLTDETWDPEKHTPFF